MAIPDDLGALHIYGAGVAANLASIRAAPALGAFAERPTQIVELVDVGKATNSIAADLTGKAALIQRDGGALVDPWATQIQNAADAGAVFAVIYNSQVTTNAPLRCPGGENLCVLAQTDYAPIPVLSVTQSKGEELRALFASPVQALAQIAYTPLSFTINVSTQLVCEHVGLRLRTDHPFRGDLRIMLTSPQGTRSILQVLGNDSSPGPIDWTYWSTHHFYESSAGDWTVTIIDQVGVNAGNVLEAVICLRGVPINDSDADGLDDTWETTWFGDLSSGPRDDPANDGRQNAREQALGFHPNSAVPDIEFRMDRSLWREERGLFHPLGPAVALDRLSWPSRPGRTYAVMTNSLVHTPFTTVTNITGNFPVTEVFLPPPTGNKFYFIRETGN